MYFILLTPSLKDALAVTTMMDADSAAKIFPSQREIYELQDIKRMSVAAVMSLNTP